MSLATITAHLELAWRRQLRRNPPTRRWARQHPVLDGDIDEIRARLADRDRHRSGPILAALVQLARAGDDDAALLVTLTLLPRMVAAETRGDDDRGYDELVGHLWEAIVTAPNPNTRCLRECLERNVWRRHRRYQRSPEATTPVDFGPERPAGIPPQALGATTNTEHDALAGHQLHATLDRLTSSGTIAPTTRRLLERLAADRDSTRPGQSTEAARKERWRATSRLRALPGLYEQLTA